MRKLDIPVALSKEFETVLAMWQSQAETRRVDALLLSWIKHEKQLRRLFCFLVFQHPDFSEHDVDDIIVVLAERYDISPEVFRRSIDTLGCKSIAGLLGQTYVKRANEMERIRLIRNKLMHGQITGLKISSPQLERDVQIVIDWVAALAVAAQQEFGYDPIIYVEMRENKIPFSGGISTLVSQDVYETREGEKTYRLTTPRREVVLSDGSSRVEKFPKEYRIIR